MRRTFVMLTAITGSIALFSGCTTPTPLSERLNSPQQGSDTPKVEIQAETEIPAESIRLVGEDSAGAIYYVARDIDDAPCIIIVSGDEWSSSCGQPGNLVIKFAGATVEFIDAGLSAIDEDDDGTEEIEGIIRVVR